MKPRIVNDPVFLEDQLKIVDNTHGLETEYNPARGDQPAFICLLNGRQEFILEKVDGGVAPLWLFPNDIDPESPISMEETINALMEQVEFGKMDDVQKIKPVSYYGKYVHTLQDALDAVHHWLSIPVKDWPKDYTKPADYVA